MQWCVSCQWVRWVLFPVDIGAVDTQLSLSHTHIHTHTHKHTELTYILVQWHAFTLHEVHTCNLLGASSTKNTSMTQTNENNVTQVLNHEYTTTTRVMSNWRCRCRISLGVVWLTKREVRYDENALSGMIFGDAVMQYRILHHYEQRVIGTGRIRTAVDSGLV